jgi:hypothetical protein
MRRRRNRPSRRRPALGQVTDVFGDRFDVYEIRPTKHGFDLLFGKPANDLGYPSYGSPGLIATQDLADFWRRNRIDQQSVRFDLPVGRRVISRVRKLMGFNYSRDVAEFWSNHIDELATLDARDFGAKYGVGRCHVLGMRRELLGGTQGDWWRKPEVLAMLKSGMKGTDVSEKLGVTLGEVYRFRRVLRGEARKAAAMPAGVEERQEAA